MNTTEIITHVVRARRFFYGPEEQTSYQFRGTLSECKQWVFGSEAEVYRTAHNESGRPTYRIVRIDSLGKYARAQAECAMSAAELRSY